MFIPPSAFLFNLKILPPGLCTASFAGLSFAVIPAGNTFCWELLLPLLLPLAELVMLIALAGLVTIALGE